MELHCLVLSNVALVCLHPVIVLKFAVTRALPYYFKTASSYRISRIVTVVWNVLVIEFAESMYTFSKLLRPNKNSVYEYFEF